MPKEEWGTKRVCPATGKRFYDLNRDPVISPYTGEPIVLDVDRAKRIAAEEDKEAANGATEFEDENIVLEDDDDDSDVSLEDEVLEDDDDDSNVSLDEIADVATEDDDS
ncbi:MAG: TIGR02300 family protein [Boseongicola sp. SB0677_bin_26]|nr:TIGR02300 family protein [Boseongicola sp. SB0665_bin_10]MYG26308.1 TIGR02300 family protein [Boseongicola sp. SB0677_bin_26]